MANAILIEPLPIANSAPGPGGLSEVGTAANLSNDYRGIIWRGTRADVSELFFDLGADRALDTVMLFGLWGDIRASARVVIHLATTAQGAGREDASKYWVSPEGFMPFAGSQPIADGNGVLLHQLPAEAPAAARYVWITFVALAGGQVQAGRVVIGKAIQLERNFANGARFGVRDLGNLDFSPRGVLIRRRARKLRTAALTFSSVRRDELEAYTKPLMERIGNTEVIALVIDPSPDPMRQTRCYLGPLVGDLGATHRKADFYEAGINVVSVF